MVSVSSGDFVHDGHRLVYYEYGSGSKPFTYLTYVADAAERAGCVVALPKSDSDLGWGSGDDEQTVAFETELAAPYHLRLRKTFSVKKGEYHVGFRFDVEPLAGKAPGKGKFRYQIAGPRGLYLAGGATLSGARGRGAYRALVRARWDYAVQRGTPALVVHAQETSRPILEGCGFHVVCTMYELESGAR